MMGILDDVPGDGKLRRVLLIVNSDPNSSGIGELLLRGIVGGEDRLEYVRYSTVQSRPSGNESHWLGHKSYARRVAMRSLPGASSALDMRFLVLQLGPSSLELRELVAREGIHMVWFVLTSSSTIMLARRLARSLQIPYVATVFDDPRYFGKNLHLDPVSISMMMRRFESILRGAARISVIGESMREEYRSRYGVDSIIMRHGLSQEHFRPWGGLGSDSSTLSVVFAGSLYAKTEWNALVSAVGTWNQVPRQRRIQVRMIGRWPRYGVKSSACVKRLGVMSFDDTLDVVSASDVAYLPYWFSRRHAMTVRTSFPGKLSAYAACGVPVLYHGPRDSSVTPFLEKYPFGIGCHSLKPAAIMASLRRIMEDKGFLARAEFARESAWREELSAKVMRRRFSELVGLPIR